MLEGEKSMLLATLSVTQYTAAEYVPLVLRSYQDNW
jgi:hypothetical protein